MRKDLHAHYRALGLDPGAGPMEIRRAYRQLMRRWHPDLFNPGSPMQATAEDITKEANEAFEQLYRKKLYRKFPPKAEPRGGPNGDADAEGSGRRTGAQETSGAAEGESPTRNGRFRVWARVARGLQKAPWSKAAIAAALVGAVVLGAQCLRGSFGAGPGEPSPAAAAVSADAPPPVVESEPAIPGDRATGTPAPRDARATQAQRAPGASLSRTRISADRAALPIRSIGARETESLSRLRVGKIGAAALPSTALAQAWDAMPGAVPESARGPGAAIPSGSDLRRRDLPVARFEGSPAATPGASRGPVSIGERDAFALGPSLREIEALLDRAEALIEVFSIGDSKARVLAVQGIPDAAGYGLYRYGSSLVYFDNGYVCGWSDDLPRLHVRTWPSLDALSAGTFSVGSTFGDVVSAQGAPSAFTATSYTYGTSVVFFRDARVTGWSEGDVTLRGFRMPSLPFGARDGLAVR